MELLTDEEIDFLRKLADDIRQRAEQTSYGYFPGGNPHDFTPDHESCTEDEMARYKRACELFDEGKVNGADGQHHWPIVDSKGEVIGHTTAGIFGVGVYSYTDSEAEGLANELDAWLDKVRGCEDMYK